MMTDVQAIRTRACPDCYLCGTRGEEIYGGMRDRLFGAPGIWSLKNCGNPECGLVWLDPMPMEEDIALAYRRYYTHQNDKIKPRGAIAQVYQQVRGILLKRAGIIEEREAQTTRYLGKQVPGKLLEVGCGAGSYLALMREAGWDVEGVEVDPAACRHARQEHGLTVHEGTLHSRDYADNSFDAIVINHVIEHVYDPVGLLRECRRAVKPGGSVVLVTPNIESWGHRKYQDSWLGLDPPRHIFLFSQNTMRKCAELAGFELINVETTPANGEGFFIASMGLQRSKRRETVFADEGELGIVQKGFRNGRALLYQLRECYRWKIDANLGEEVVMICRKREG